MTPGATALHSGANASSRSGPSLRRTSIALREPDDLTLASYMHFTAATPFKGPVALVGNSAHATSPQLGQGANNGLLDALALRDALASAPDIASALSLYAKARRDHVRFYQFASWLMTPFFQSDSTTLALARDLTFHRMRICRTCAAKCCARWRG